MREAAQSGKAARRDWQFDPHAGADPAGAVLDRPRPPDVERRPAAPRCRSSSRPRPDRAHAGHRARRRRRRDDRLLRRQIPLLVLAPLPGNPGSRRGQQPRHQWVVKHSAREAAPEQPPPAVVQQQGDSNVTIARTPPEPSDGSRCGLLRGLLSVSFRRERQPGARRSIDRPRLGSSVP